MGFLSKIRKGMKKQVAQMPRRRGGFLRGMPMMKPIARDMRFRGRMPSRGGFGNLGEAIRRLNEQQGMMPQPIPRAEIDISALERLPMGDMPMTQDLPEVAPVGMMPQMRMGGMQDMEPRMMMAEGDEVIDRSPEQELFSLQTQLENLQKQLEMDRSYNDLQTIVDTSAEIEAIQKRMAEIQMEMARQKMISENPYNLPFDSDAKAAREKLEEERRPALEEEYRSNPYNYPFNKISIEERKRLRPQLAEGGDFPDLTGDGKVTQADILKGRGVYAEGDEVKSFADYQPEGSLKGTFFDYIPDGYQVSSFLMDKFGQEAAQDPTIREMFEKEFKAARMAGKDVFEFMGKPYNTKTLEEVEGMRYGGEMERFQDGGEIDAMLGGMDSEVEGAMESMEELEQMAPEMEMIDQLVTMVVQMIQQGASEEEVIMFLREQGLDDEDIGTVLQLVAEMAEAEAMPQDGIGAELEQLV